MSADRSIALPCPAETSTAPLSKFIAGRCASLTRSDKVPLHVRGESITPVPSRARRSISPERQFSGSNRNLFSDSAAIFSAVTLILAFREDSVSFNAVETDNWPPPMAASSLTARALKSIRDASILKSRICSLSLRARSRRMKSLCV